MYLTEEITEEREGYRKVNLPEIDGYYELTCSACLVQALGACSGIAFYFRAKYGEWEFETHDEHGHPFAPGDARRFLLREKYDEAKPGAMGVDWAARIIGRCL